MKKLDLGEDMPTSFKLYWALHATTLGLSVLITVMYWTVVYNKDKDDVDAKNILTHVFNSVVMFIDLIVVAHPVRFLHCIFPIVVGLSYGLFSFIYYQLGGTTM